MTASAYWPIMVFALVTAVSPGPANFLIMYTAARGGPLAAVPVILGLCVGFQSALAAGLIAANAGAQLADWTLTLLKIGGVAYLLYLAWAIGRAGPVASGVVSGVPVRSMAGWRGFSAGLILNWLNPKGWLMVAGAAALGASIGGHPVTRTLLLCGLFLAAGLISIAVWLIFGAVLTRAMRSARIAPLVNGAMAVSLVVAAGAMALG